MLETQVKNINQNYSCKYKNKVLLLYACGLGKIYFWHKISKYK